MSRVGLVLFSLLILILILACNTISLSPATPTVDSQAAIDNAILQTQQALTLVALSVQQTIAAAGGGAPPPALPTNTYQFTDTLSIVTVTVSIDTNCRQGGGGSSYPVVGSLLVGQTAEIVGRSPSGDNWIVTLPGRTSTCWLWSYYTTVVGETASLPIFYPEATPTFTSSPFINITLVNNSPTVTINEVYIMDTTDSIWGNNEMSGTIPPGGAFTWFDYLPGTYDIKAISYTPFQVLKTWIAVSMDSDTILYYP